VDAEEEEEEDAGTEGPDWLRRRDDEDARFEPAATPEDDDADRAASAPAL
jgi:hypothetical protein